MKSTNKRISKGERELELEAPAVIIDLADHSRLIQLESGDPLEHLVSPFPDGPGCDKLFGLQVAGILLALGGRLSCAPTRTSSSATSLVCSLKKTIYSSGRVHRSRSLASFRVSTRTHG